MGESNVPPAPSSILVPLDHAYDALSELVSHFRNEMLRRGIRELPAREWAESFRDWIDPYEFEEDYGRLMEFFANEEKRT